MAKGLYPNKDWSTDRQGAVQFIFNTHFWGDRTNSGKGEKGNWKVRKADKVVKVAVKKEVAPVASKGKKK